MLEASPMTAPAPGSSPGFMLRGISLRPLETGLWRPEDVGSVWVEGLCIRKSRGALFGFWLHLHLVARPVKLHKRPYPCPAVQAAYDSGADSSVWESGFKA